MVVAPDHIMTSGATRSLGSPFLDTSSSALTGQTSVTSLSDSSFSSAVAAAELLEADGGAADSAIYDALKSGKERLFMLRLGESMESLIIEKR